jgi:hypothetical protein
MDFRYINRTDLIVIGTCALSLATFSINTKLDSIIPVYLNSFVVLGMLTYWAIRKDVTGMLRRGLIIGGISGFFYSFVDSIFVDGGIITYLRSEDVDVFATPVSTILIWIYCVAIAIYLYQRLRSLFSKFYIPAALTGASAFLLGIVLNYFGDHARLWVWNIGVPSSPAIGSTPLFVPVALFFTFFLSPYIVGGQRISARISLPDNPIAGGLRCALILATTLYISFRIFTG